MLASASRRFSQPIEAVVLVTTRSRPESSLIRNDALSRSLVRKPSTLADPVRVTAAPSASWWMSVTTDAGALERIPPTTERIAVRRVAR